MIDSKVIKDNNHRYPKELMEMQYFQNGDNPNDLGMSFPDGGSSIPGMLFEVGQWYKEFFDKSSQYKAFRTNI